jgi:Uma2 family endonuclease
MVEATSLMAIKEFIRLYDQEGPFELVDGERVILSPTVARHNLIIKTLFIALHNHAETQQLGKVFSELPFILSDRLDWVKGSRTPDVMFVLARRWIVYPIYGFRKLNEVQIMKKQSV